ncbi:DUF3558 domain-containing protein [Crossiella sp. SN42]|uniref:DUF3558 domain-containing protein n=1 Tax=Crossiella sp. SN42 TaxID=2944808 RepID=UPI00207D15BE|nr:DUF3558 domain-containing protein [Crossiella sp. SN42]MCO1579057.1 DUF3558 domain-containing protein [Crossiella sp. SN42]
MRTRTLVTLAAAGLLASGCSTGGNTPGGTTTPAGLGLTTTTTTSVAIPKRPRDLAANGIQACDVLTPEQKVKLKITDAKPGTGERASTEPYCAYFVDPIGSTLHYGFNVAPVSNTSLEYWFQGVTATVKLIDVAGFPAARVSSKSGTGGTGNQCGINIGIADGKTLGVEGSLIEAPFTEDQMCDETVKVAEAALATLIQHNK